MEHLRIAIMCDSLTHYTAGSMTATLRFAAHLAARGHIIVFLTTKQRDESSIDTIRGMKTYRFRSIRLPGSNGQFLLALPRKKQIESILTSERIDILYAIDPTPATMTCINAAKKLGISTVAHAHFLPEMFVSQAPRPFHNRVFTEMVYKRVTAIYRHVDKVICPSPFIEKRLKLRDPTIATIHISNGADLSAFGKRDPHSFLRKYGESSTDRRLLFVGRLQKEKSVHTAIEAMPHILQRYPRTHLDIVGDGDQRKELEELARTLGVETSITFFGKLFGDDLVMAYNASSMFVLPSFIELEPVVIYEAMACGKPLLISDSIMNPASRALKGNGLVFRWKDPVDLAKKANILLQNAKKRRLMSAKSASLAKEYDIKNSVDKIERLFLALAEKTHS